MPNDQTTPNPVASPRSKAPASSPAGGKDLTNPVHPMLRTLGLPELAQILGKTEGTLRNELSATPWSLPPRFKPPGSGRVLWLEHVVIDWVQKVQAGKVDLVKVRTGRKRQVPA